MAEFSGMNVDSILNRVAPGFHNQSQAVNTVINEVQKLIAIVQSDWKGNDSRQFVDKWNQEYHRPLMQLARDLEQLSTLARKNATTQQQTSSAL